MNQNSSEIFERFSTQEPPTSPEPSQKPAEAEVVREAAQNQQNLHTPPRKQGGTLGRIVREIFGQFFTVEFWKDAARIVVQELFSTFLISFGNSVAFIGRQRRNDKVGNSAASGPPGEISSRAFGGGRGISSVPSTPKVDVMSRFGYT